MSSALNRRQLVFGSAAASGAVLLPVIGSREQTSFRPRLVVVIARGGMDGLSLTPPRDSLYQSLRGPIAIPAAAQHAFDGDFGLHPSLHTIAGLARQGLVRLAPAAGLWLSDRSHFRAQDLLETGTRSAGEASGWLGRALAAMQGGETKALSIGGAPTLMTEGPQVAQSWGLDQPATSPFLLDTLDQLYLDDPLLAAASRDLRGFGLLAERRAGQAPDADPVVRTAQTAARFLQPADGASIAVLSFYGFDTHAAQGAATGPLASSFSSLDRAIAALQAGLGSAWTRTAVLVVTEFGRTAAVNGRGGTDHGSASTALLTGGAVKRGGLLGDWPGLASAALFEGRDVRPVLDLRALFKGVLMEHFGLDPAVLARSVFPGTETVRPLDGLVSAGSRPGGTGRQAGAAPAQSAIRPS